MRRILVVLTVCLSSFSSRSQDLEINHLKGDFYVFTTYQEYKGNRVPANGLYVVTSEGVVMIDTPWDPAQFQPLLDSIRSRHHKSVVICIATHWHSDRTGGLEYYRKQGIKTFTTAKTDKLCRKNNAKRAEFVMAKDTVIKLGQYNVETFYPGPGHSSDNIVVWFNKDRVLYGGCFVKSAEAKDLGNLSDADTSRWPKSIQNVQARFKNPAYVIPGHDSWESNKGLEHTLQLLK